MNKEQYSFMLAKGEDLTLNVFFFFFFFLQVEGRDAK